MNVAAPASLPVKTAYGLGAVSTGVSDTGFNYFLLIFYSQVVGLDARLVSLAITASLMFDALADPVVGVWSDNFRSRWGRRHPFIYASALPAAVSYAFLWMPPAGWDQQSLFWYLLGMSVLIRVFITFYETPSSALLPELTYDYDDRASVQGARFFFGWSGGNVMTVAMFLAIFPAFVTPAIANGQFNRDAYALYGVIAGVVILVSILICGLGTHRGIASFQSPPASRRMNVATIFAETRATLSDRSFGVLFAAAVLGAIAQGLSASLTFYFTTFFWGFSATQIGLITIGVFASAALGGMLAPFASRRLGKKRGAMVIGLIAFVGAPLPIMLRLMDLLPANGDPRLFWIVFAANTLDTGLVICFQILTSAMVADLVDRAELRTGRRSEGVFFAALTFVKKAVLGLGLIAASLILTMAHFPAGAKAGQVAADSVWRLGTYYVPAVLLLWLSMMAVVSRYRLTRQDHEANILALAVARAATIRPAAAHSSTVGRP